MPISKCL